MTYTKQEMFDKVWDHFITQGGKPSVGENQRCWYRGKDGAKCAFGLFIPDELYNPSMEAQSSTYLLNPDHGYFPQEFLDQFTDVKQFTWEIQQCHDKSALTLFCEFKRTMEINLRALATQNKLTVPTT